MRGRLTITLAIVASILAGCVVVSVCPYYSRENLVSEPALLGSWVNPSNTDEIWTFEPSRALAYRFTLIESSKATVMEAHTFKLQGQLFLDIFSLEQDFHVIPAHYLLKVSQVTPTLRLYELNDAWLKELFAKDPSVLRHHFVQSGDKPADLRLILTGDTPELQKFIIEHLSTELAWKEAFELNRYSISDKPAK